MIWIRRTLDEMKRAGTRPRSGITITDCRPGETTIGRLEVACVRPWHEAGVQFGWWFGGQG